jgi:predicted small lipoprotein YifL
MFDMKVLALISVLILSSCGMPGDLYLPEEKAGDKDQEKGQETAQETVQETDQESDSK